MDHFVEVSVFGQGSQLGFRPDFFALYSRSHNENLDQVRRLSSRSFSPLTPLAQFRFRERSSNSCGAAIDGSPRRQPWAGVLWIEAA